MKPDIVTKGLASTCLLATGVAGKMVYDHHFYGLGTAVDLQLEFSKLDKQVALELQALSTDVKQLKTDVKQIKTDLRNLPR